MGTAAANRYSGDVPIYFMAWLARELLRGSVTVPADARQLEIASCPDDDPALTWSETTSSAGWSEARKAWVAAYVPPAGSGWPPGTVIGYG